MISSFVGDFLGRASIIMFVNGTVEREDHDRILQTRWGGILTSWAPVDDRKDIACSSFTLKSVIPP